METSSGLNWDKKNLKAKKGLLSCSVQIFPYNSCNNNDDDEDDDDDDVDDDIRHNKGVVKVMKKMITVMLSSR